MILSSFSWHATTVFEVANFSRKFRHGNTVGTSEKPLLPEVEETGIGFFIFPRLAGLDNWITFCFNKIIILDVQYGAMARSVILL